jgi:uncharacterized Zn-binding protein involved in type VI secretion
MPQPAAKQGDRVVATDMHLVKQGNAVSSLPHPFDGVISSNCVPDVLIEGNPAAVVGSVAINRPHIPMGDAFVVPPRNQGTIVRGSATVRIGGKAAARAGDIANTCNDPVDQPVGQVVATSTVLIGG